jgi:TonB family protein
MSLGPDANGDLSLLEQHALVRITTRDDGRLCLQAVTDATDLEIVGLCHTREVFVDPETAATLNLCDTQLILNTDFGPIRKALPPMNIRISAAEGGSPVPVVETPASVTEPARRISDKPRRSSTAPVIGVVLIAVAAAAGIFYVATSEPENQITESLVPSQPADPSVEPVPEGQSSPLSEPAPRASDLSSPSDTVATASQDTPAEEEITQPGPESADSVAPAIIAAAESAVATLESSTSAGTDATSVDQADAAPAENPAVEDPAVDSPAEKGPTDTRTDVAMAPGALLAITETDASPAPAADVASAQPAPETALPAYTPSIESLDAEVEDIASVADANKVQEIDVESQISSVTESLTIDQKAILPFETQTVLDGTGRYVEQELAADVADQLAHQRKVANARAGIFDELYPYSLLTPTRQSPPSIPRRAPRGARVSVQLEFTVTDEGRVKDVEVIGKPPGIFILAAVDAAKKWRFEPVVENGDRLSVRTTLAITFRN